MRHMRPVLPALVLYLATFLTCVALATVPAGCGASQRTKTLNATLVAVNAARDSFFAWDLEHQKSIVDASTTREDLDKKIAAYREKQGRILDGFIAVYRAIAAAFMLSDDPSLTKAIRAAGELLQAIETHKNTEVEPARDLAEKTDGDGG